MEWSITTKLEDDIFDEDILEDLCIKSELPFDGRKVKITLEEVK